MKTKPRQEVNCKTCGDVIDITRDPENWPLQCSNCKKRRIPLQREYEEVDDKHKAAS